MSLNVYQRLSKEIQSNLNHYPYSLEKEITSIEQFNQILILLPNYLYHECFKMDDERNSFIGIQAREKRYKNGMIYFNGTLVYKDKKDGNTYRWKYLIVTNDYEREPCIYFASKERSVHVLKVADAFSLDYYNCSNISKEFIEQTLDIHLDNKYWSKFASYVDVSCNQTLRESYRQIHPVNFMGGEDKVLQRMSVGVRDYDFIYHNNKLRTVYISNIKDNQLNMIPSRSNIYEMVYLEVDTMIWKIKQVIDKYFSTLNYRNEHYSKLKKK